ncbi:MAG: efflux RND transporter periplasmic adaptor subunit [Ignavibacteria bacterium]
MTKLASHSLRSLKPGIVFAALVVAIALLAWRAFAHSAPQLPPATGEAASGFRPTAEQWAGLETAEVQLQTFRTVVHAEGAIAYNEEATTAVFSPWSGRVSRLIAKPGDYVRKGAPLMAVESSEFVQAQSDAAGAKAALAHAQAVEKRQHELLEAGIASLKDWQQAQADLAAAEAAWSAARGRLRVLGRSEADIDAVRKTPLAPIEALVVAPLSGTVTQRQVGLGQYIQSVAGGASAPVFTVSDLSTVWLVANVREGDAPRLKVGQEADVNVLALPGRSFKARVTWVGAALDPVTHRVPVRTEIKNANGELKPQMFADVAIATGDEATAPAVPQSAVMYEGAAARVFVVSADGRIAGRSVTTGRSADGFVEVSDGLKAGEKIVVAGALFVDRAIKAGGS